MSGNRRASIRLNPNGSGSGSSSGSGSGSAQKPNARSNKKSANNAKNKKVEEPVQEAEKPANQNASVKKRAYVRKNASVKGKTKEQNDEPEKPAEQQEEESEEKKPNDSSAKQENEKKKEDGASNSNGQKKKEEDKNDPKRYNIFNETRFLDKVDEFRKNLFKERSSNPYLFKEYSEEAEKPKNINFSRGKDEEDQDEELATYHSIICTKIIKDLCTELMRIATLSNRSSKETLIIKQKSIDALKKEINKQHPGFETIFKALENEKDVKSIFNTSKVKNFFKHVLEKMDTGYEIVTFSKPKEEGSGSNSSSKSNSNSQSGSNKKKVNSKKGSNKNSEKKKKEGHNFITNSFSHIVFAVLYFVLEIAHSCTQLTSFNEKDPMDIKVKSFSSKRLKITRKDYRRAILISHVDKLSKLAAKEAKELGKMHIEHLKPFIDAGQPIIESEKAKAGRPSSSGNSNSNRKSGSNSSKNSRSNSGSGSNKNDAEFGHFQAVVMVNKQKVNFDIIAPIRKTNEKNIAVNLEDLNKEIAKKLKPNLKKEDVTQKNRGTIKSLKKEINGSFIDLTNHKPTERKKSVAGSSTKKVKDENEKNGEKDESNSSKSKEKRNGSKKKNNGSDSSEIKKKEDESKKLEDESDPSHRKEKKDESNSSKSKEKKNGSKKQEGESDSSHRKEKKDEPSKKPDVSTQSIKKRSKSSSKSSSSDSDDKQYGLFKLLTNVKGDDKYHLTTILLAPLRKGGNISFHTKTIQQMFDGAVSHVEETTQFEQIESKHIEKLNHSGSLEEMKKIFKAKQKEKDRQDDYFFLDLSKSGEILMFEGRPGVFSLSS